MPTSTWSDVSLGDVVLDQEGKKLDVEIDGSILDATINRSILQASTLTIVVHDPYQKLLNSGLLANLFTVAVDGHKFEIVKVEKDADTITLTFNDWAVALLKKNAVPMKAARAKLTRAQFVKRMVDQEPRVKLFAPEINIKQPIASTKALQKRSALDSQRQSGFPDKVPSDIQIKGTKATAEQLKNIDIVLQTGKSMGADDFTLVTSIATIIQESSAINLSGGDRDSVGLFQQRPSQGWGTAAQCHDQAHAANEFFQRAIVQRKEHKNFTITQLAQSVQISGFPDAYQRWADEAKKIFNFWTGQDEFAVVEGGANVSAKGTPIIPYEFHRGGPGHKGETTWGAAVRLAQEVDWLCFTVGMTLYFITQTDLYTSRPIATIDDNTLGVENIAFDYDLGKPVSHGELTVHAERWQVEPGAVIMLENCGPANGRWLVTEIDRSMMDTEATITIQKPLKPLLEPPAQSGTKVVKANKLVADGSLGGDTVISVARGFLGQGYVMSSNHPGLSLVDLQNGKSEKAPFDCSSFVYWCWLVGGHVELGGAGGSNTTGLIQWAKQTKSNVWLQGTTKPSGGWKAGDVIFPTAEQGEHVCLATGEGSQTIAARTHATGIGYDANQPDTCFFFFRPIPG